MTIRTGLRWLVVGLLISAIPPLIALIWTMAALGEAAGPLAQAKLILDVTAHQWWWDIRYNAKAAAGSFETANEIHIPVGMPVLIRLHADDVIHSFWVPKLSSKTAVIPGQTTLRWIEAPAAGRYRGQCSEYCGDQHANMGFEVVAQSKADFEQCAPRNSPPHHHRRAQHSAAG